MRMNLLVAALLVGCHHPASDPADPDVDAGATDGTTDGAVATDSDPNAPVTLATPVKKEIFLEMVNSAEQSDLNWTAAYPYCEDIHDGRGYTTGIAGFTTNSAGATTDDGPGVLGVVLNFNMVTPG